MSTLCHTDEHKASVWNTLRQHDLQPCKRLLPDSLIQSDADRAGIPIGRGALNLITLAWLALLCSVEKGRSFADIIQMTLKLLHDAQCWGQAPSPCLLPARRGRRRGGVGRKAGGSKRRRSQHDPRGRDPNLVTEEAFVQAR